MRLQIVFKDPHNKSNHNSDENSVNVIIKHISLLSYACIIKSIDIVKVLIQNESIDMNVYDADTGNTPLITSIERKNEDIIKLLINQPKTNINLQNYEGKSALMFAIQAKLTEIVKLLLNNERFDPDECNINQAFFATNAKELLECKSLNVNYIPFKCSSVIKITNNAVIKSPFINSILNNNTELFGLIIQHPSFVKYETQIIDALHVAIKQDKDKFIPKLFDLLSEFNIDVNSHIFNNNSVLIEAIKLNSNSKTISSILDCPNFDSKKSDVLTAFNLSYKYFTSKDEKQQSLNRITALEKITIMDILYDYDNKHDHLIDLKGSSLLSDIYSSIFIKNNVNPNASKGYDENPLEFSIRNNLYVLSLCLIYSKKIDVDSKFYATMKQINKYGNSSKYNNINDTTYLHLAVIHDRKNIVEEILSSKLCNVNIETNEGETALMKACRNLNAECVKILFKENDLDFLHQNTDKEDAIHILYKMYGLKKLNSDEIKDKDEYLAKLLDLIEKIQIQRKSMHQNKLAHQNSKQSASKKQKNKKYPQSSSNTEDQSESAANEISKDENSNDEMNSNAVKQTDLTSSLISQDKSSESNQSESTANKISKDEMNSNTVKQTESTTAPMSQEKSSELNQSESSSNAVKQPESTAAAAATTDNSHLKSNESESAASKISNDAMNSLKSTSASNPTSSKQSNELSKIDSRMKELHESNDSKTPNLKQTNFDALEKPLNKTENYSQKTKFKIYHESFTEEANPIYQHHHQQKTQTDDSMIRENITNYQREKESSFKELKRNRKVSSLRKRKTKKIDDIDFDDDEFINQNAYFEQQNQFRLLQQQQQQWFQMIQINNELQAQINIQMMNQFQMDKQAHRQLKKRKK